MAWKVMLHLILIILTKGMQWCHWWCCLHCLIWILTPVMSHCQIHDVAPHFKYLGLRNAMVPLTILLACYGADTTANGVNVQKVILYLILIVFTYGIQWYLFNTISIMWCQQKCQCCTTFWLSWLKKCSSAIGEAIDITWYWCWCQWHHMTKKVILYLILIILT